MSSYLGRSHQSRAGYGEKSAEVIVGTGIRANTLQRAMLEVSRSIEGLNVKLFQMLQGSFRQSADLALR